MELAAKHGALSIRKIRLRLSEADAKLIIHSLRRFLVIKRIVMKEE